MEGATLGQHSPATDDVERRRVPLGHDGSDPAAGDADATRRRQRSDELDRTIQQAMEQSDQNEVHRRRQIRSTERSRSVARRPRWIVALLLALGIAAGFARSASGRSVARCRTATVVVVPGRDRRPRSRRWRLRRRKSPIAPPARWSSVVGRRVAGDTYVVSDRANFGVTGYWVIGHVVASNGASVALALGWTKTRARRMPPPTS